MFRQLGGVGFQPGQGFGRVHGQPAFFPGPQPGQCPGQCGRSVLEPVQGLGALQEQGGRRVDARGFGTAGHGREGVAVFAEQLQGGASFGGVVRVEVADVGQGGGGGLLVAAHGGQGGGVVAQEVVLFLASHGQDFESGGHGQAFEPQHAFDAPRLQPVHGEDEAESGKNAAEKGKQLVLDAHGSEHSPDCRHDRLPAPRADGGWRCARAVRRRPGTG